MLGTTARPGGGTEASAAHTNIHIHTVNARSIDRFTGLSWSFVCFTRVTNALVSSITLTPSGLTLRPLVSRPRERALPRGQSSTYFDCVCCWNIYSAYTHIPQIDSLCPLTLNDLFTRDLFVWIFLRQAQTNCSVTSESLQSHWLDFTDINWIGEYILGECGLCWFDQDISGFNLWISRRYNIYWAQHCEEWAILSRISPVSMCSSVVSSACQSRIHLLNLHSIVSIFDCACVPFHLTHRLDAHNNNTHSLVAALSKPLSLDIVSMFKVISLV